MAQNSDSETPLLVKDIVFKHWNCPHEVAALLKDNEIELPQDIVTVVDSLSQEWRNGEIVARC